MKKSIITSLLMFSSYFLIGQNLVDLKCIETEDHNSTISCKWYITNKNNKTVEVVIGKKQIGCDNQVLKEGKLTKTIGPNKRSYVGLKEKNICQPNYGWKYTIISTKYVTKK